MPFDPLGWWTDAINYTSQAWRSGAFDPDVVARRAVVLHITDGVDSRKTLGSPNSKVSSHFLNRQEGVYQHVSIFDTSYANGLSYKNGRWIDPAGNVVNPPWQGLEPPTNPNYTTISIENEGRPGIPLSPKQQQQLTAILRALAVQYPQFMPYVPGVNLIGHRDIAPIHRARCPGSAFDFQAIAAAANADLLGATQPGAALLTEHSNIFGAPSITFDQGVDFILKRGSLYTPYDVRVIVGQVFHVCQPVGVDPGRVLAQIIHETSEQIDDDPEWEPLSSFWAQRPRRNPAGIGVDGTPGHGVLFPTWLDSIQAQVGRLLRYFLKPGQGTEAQQHLMETALKWRPLDRVAWGSCTELQHLGAIHNPANAGLPRNKWRSGWAWPGEFYGRKIAEIANAIRGQG